MAGTVNCLSLDQLGCCAMSSGRKRWTKLITISNRVT